MASVAGPATNMTASFGAGNGISNVQRLAWGLLAAILLFFAALPVDLAVQGAMAATGIAAILALRVLPLGAAGRLLLLAIALFISFRYLFWRVTDTISLADPLSFAASLTLFVAELYGFTIHLLGVFVSAHPMRRPPKTAPLDPALLPTVDILVPSYNEDTEMLEVTLMAAVNVRYPAEKRRVYLCDDGGTEQKRNDPDPGKAAAAAARHIALKALCARVGATYLTRARNDHAKAGNVNAALQSVSGDLVLILDADHVPTVDILERTTGWFIDNPRLFLVQSPHFFLNPDPIERNLGLFSMMPSENEMFYRIIQPGLDLWNASFFCGSAALMRRSCLDEIGGLTGETITEDAETALALHARGYDSAFVDRPMVAGLSPETMAGFIAQRSRWTQGMVQIFILKNPLLQRGLTLPQRLGYLSASLFWFFPFARLVFLLSPLAYLIFGLSIYDANFNQVLAFTVPHLFAMIIASNYMYGRVRWQFISELYEVMQSFFCFSAIVKVIRRPRSPQFVVTPKGEHLENDFISGLANPFYIVLLLLLAATVTGVYRLHVFPDDRDLTAIVLGWNIFNICFLVAALGILLERRQRRASPRVAASWTATAVIDGQTSQWHASDLSIGGAGLTAAPAVAARLRDGDDGMITLRNSAFGTLRSIPFVVRSVVQRGSGDKVGIAFRPASADDLFAIVKAVHSRSEHWSAFQEGRSQTTDSMIKQVTRLMRLGMKHAASHLGQLVAIRVAAWRAS